MQRLIWTEHSRAPKAQYGVKDSRRVHRRAGRWVKHFVCLKKNILKRWFEIFPEKIVFGSDCFPYSREVNVPLTYWLAIDTSRTAAAAALAEMVSEGDITEARALEIARLFP